MMPDGGRSAVTEAEIHLYPVDLTAGNPDEDEVLLSPSECARAAKYHFPHHRHRFIRGRAELRRIVGRHLRMAPPAVPLMAGPHGKPMVEAPAGLAFNLSHSEHFGLLAVGLNRAVGVDVELLGSVADRRQLGEQTLSPGELALLAGAPPEQRDRLFLQCWTRKEAYLKMLGKGIAVVLSDLNVGVANGAPAEVDASLLTFVLGGFAVASLASDRPWHSLRLQSDRLDMDCT